MTRRARLLRSLAVLMGLAAALVVAAYLRSEWLLEAVYPAPPSRLIVATDSGAIARGAHLVKAVGTCAVCHGGDYGGAIYADIPFVGIVAGPNLTSGRGGIGESLSDEDWIRALRYGVRRDGTSLIAMPSEVFTHFSDQDLAAVVAFLRQLPPVDRELPQTKFRLVGRMLLAAGRLDLLTAPKTNYAQSAAPLPAPTAEYGSYLARAAGCAGCHGSGFSGGHVAGPPNLPVAANITPAGIGDWSEAEFVRVMREGRRPDGTVLADFMPWPFYGEMSDMELRALWRYLQTVPPKPSGGK